MYKNSARFARKYYFSLSTSKFNSMCYLPLLCNFLWNLKVISEWKSSEFFIILCHTCNNHRWAFLLERHHLVSWGCPSLPVCNPVKTHQHSPCNFHYMYYSNCKGDKSSHLPFHFQTTGSNSRNNLHPGVSRWRNPFAGTAVLLLQDSKPVQNHDENGI